MTHEPLFLAEEDAQVYEIVDDGSTLEEAVREASEWADSEGEENE